jgi:hypothetical protein
MYTLDRSRCRCLLLAVTHRAPPSPWLPWPSFGRHRNSLPLVSSCPNEPHQHLRHLASHLPRFFPGSGRRCIAGVACNRRHGHGCAWSRHCGPPLDELSPCSGARVAQAGRTGSNRRWHRPRRRPAKPDRRLPCSVVCEEEEGRLGENSNFPRG